MIPDFLSNRPEAIKAINCIKEFSALSKNLNKSVLFPLKECDQSVVNGIPVKKIVTYLGVVIDKNEKLHSDLNFDPIVEQITKKFNMWLMRDFIEWQTFTFQSGGDISSCVCGLITGNTCCNIQKIR